MAEPAPKRSSGVERKPAPPRQGVVKYLLTRYEPLTSLVLILPVFLLYHLGILLVPLRNGVDVVSELTLRLLHHSVLEYAGATLAVAAALVGAAFFLRKRSVLDPKAFVPVLVESAVLAVLLSTVVGYATQALTPAQVGPHALTALEKLVMAAGAGLHEELVFRVVLFAGGALVVRNLFPLGVLYGTIIAAVVSSLVFSAVHYLGPLGDTLGWQSFVFRTFAGLFLCAVYKLRGLAPAVYTHFFYDLFVFFLWS